MNTPTAALLSDELWPRDEAHRFRIYGRKGKSLEVIACTPTAAGIGATIVELHADAKLAGGEFGDHGQLGVLDAVLGEWIINPFSRPTV